MLLSTGVWLVFLIQLTQSIRPTMACLEAHLPSDYDFVRLTFNAIISDSA